MGKPSAPAPPDYRGAAEAQGQANLEAARLTAQLSNPNFITPLGTQTVSFGTQRQFDQAGYDSAMRAYNQQVQQNNARFPFGGNQNTNAPAAPNREQFYFDAMGNQPTVTQSLTPEGQRLFDQQMRISQSYGDTAEAGLGRINNAMGQDFDMSNITDYSIDPSVAGAEQVTQALIDRNQPFIDRSREQTNNDLLIRGHTRGGQAWDATQDDLNRQENDMRLAAILAGGQEQSRIAGLESNRRAQDFQEQSFLRNLPLSEINALRTGSQPGMPQFQAYQGAQVGAAPLFDATLAQGNFAQQNYQNQLNSSGGIFDLAGAGLGAASAAGGFGNLFSFG